MAYRVRLQWQEGAPSEQGSGFKIYRSINGGAFALVATLPLSQTSWEETIQPGNTYTYRVYEYLSLPGGDVLSPYAEKTVRLIVPSIDQRFSYEAWRVNKEALQSETLSALEAARIRARIGSGEFPQGEDNVSLLAQIRSGDQGAISGEAARLSYADLKSLDLGLGDEAVESIARGYFKVDEQDLGEGSDDALLRALIKGLDRLYGHEAGNIQAILAVMDVSGSRERPVFIFVRRMGEPWGMIEVAPGPIQK
jgi:hypothetical protein